MCTKSLNLSKVLILMMGLCFGSLLYATPNACTAVPVTVVNSSNQDLSIRGGQGVTVVPAKSTMQVAFASNHLYTKCGLIEVSFNGQDFQKGMIADAATGAVNIHVQPSGNIEEVGLTDPGFKLDEYISWWGLGAVLG